MKKPALYIFRTAAAICVLAAAVSGVIDIIGNTNRSCTENKAEGDAGERRHSDAVFDYSWMPAGDGYIAHAFGGIDGKTYTNSREAFETNYQAGHRVFEVDLDYMKDDASVILCHDEEYWRSSAGIGEDTAYNRENFMHSALCGAYTPMDLNGLIQLMKAYPDIYIVIDSKYPDRESVTLQYSRIIQLAEAAGPGVIERIIPQVYTEDMYWILMDMYPFRSVIFTLYQIFWTPREVYDFCVDSGVRFVTLYHEKLTPEIAELWQSLGIHIAVHTVNDPEEAEKYFNMGAEMIYTDFLTGK